MIHGLARDSLVEDTIPEQTGTQVRFPDGERAAVKRIGSPGAAPQPDKCALGLACLPRVQLASVESPRCLRSRSQYAML